MTLGLTNGGESSKLRNMTTATVYTFGPITVAQYFALSWAEPRGYCAGIIGHADEIVEHADGTMTLRFSEPSAWNVADDARDDKAAVGTCLADPLPSMLWAFLDGIV